MPSSSVLSLYVDPRLTPGLAAVEMHSGHWALVHGVSIQLFFSSSSGQGPRLFSYLFRFEFGPWLWPYEHFGGLIISIFVCIIIVIINHQVTGA